MMVVYCTGISQPAKSTRRPPWAACQSCSGVRSSAMNVLPTSEPAPWTGCEYGTDKLRIRPRVIYNVASQGNTDDSPRCGSSSNLTQSSDRLRLGTAAVPCPGFEQEQPDV